MDARPEAPKGQSSAIPSAGIRWVRPRLLSAGEVALLAFIIAVGMLAFRVFDEWRGPIKVIHGLLVSGLVVFFVSRAFWSWWRVQPTAIVTKGAVVAPALALVGWLDLGLAKAVVGISSSNYSLIIIAPLMMMLGALVSLGGLLGAGLGVAVTITGLTRPMARPSLIVIAGIVAAVLNLAHIVLLVRILVGD